MNTLLSVKNNFDFERIEPYYQPIIDLSNGEVYGYECLARLVYANNHATSAGWLFNDNNIEINSRITLDRLLHMKAMDHFSNNLESEHLFININPSWLNAEDLKENSPLLNTLRSLEIKAGRIIVEIVEHKACLNIIQDFVSLLKRQGLKIAIDDFGIEDSQIDRLIALQPDFIKIDMHLFKNASRNGNKAKVVQALSQLANQSHCEIICEGVETEQEFDFAIECGAQKIQGHLFSKAMRNTGGRYLYLPQINALKSTYLVRKTQHIKQSIIENNQLNKHIKRIVEHYQLGTIKALNVQEMAAAGIQRFFVCNESGQQLTPNYEFNGKKIVANSQCAGWNWAHRPYVPILLAVKGTLLRKQAVSNAYLDSATQRYCKTYGFILHDQTLLFIDILAKDELLYCDTDNINSLSPNALT